MTNNQFTVAVDFDGVINNYSRYKGKGVFEEPVPGVVEAFRTMKAAGWTIIINTTRSETWLIEEYCKKHGILFDYINHNPANNVLHLSPTKVIADVYVDDRNVRFDGNWCKAIDEIRNFKPWYRRKDEE